MFKVIGQNNNYPNGQQQIAIRQIAAVYGRPVAVIAFVESRALPGRTVTIDTMVTRRQVERAEAWQDHDDALSVLHDIDTQWGMFPEGGMLDVAGGWSD